MMLKIKATQSEKNWLTILLAEYIDDIFKQVLAQNIYKTEVPTPRHHSRSINAYTYTKLESIKKQKIEERMPDAIIPKVTLELQTISLD
ncbi:6991_t:CDS:2 [Scutellospora calospora]|uniref:6991_t:CDS:1 n=1 Tax=Scutellospora calospora TaxID=85575 RepID=A0ACA9JY42_9GLOM|nr:6991_t:CDS:2 [Scutellospora calospora]